MPKRRAIAKLMPFALKPGDKPALLAELLSLGACIENSENDISDSQASHRLEAVACSLGGVYTLMVNFPAVRASGLLRGDLRGIYLARPAR